VKSIDKQVKLRVTLLDSGENMTISDEQIDQSVPLHIGATITIRLSTSSQQVHAYHSRSSSSSSKSSVKKTAIIKQIIDNSIYTVVFNDGDETSLRRASLCLQGIRLYQNQTGQPKLSTNVRSAASTIIDTNDDVPVVCIQRKLKTTTQVFPALTLKRKALPDYLWVKSFLDGKEYVVHQHNDVQSYRNNPEIQSLCRLTSKQATQACDSYIRTRKIPAVWQKNMSDDNERDTDTYRLDDDSDDETTEEKDTFVAQLLAFMDDRGKSMTLTNIERMIWITCDFNGNYRVHMTFQVRRSTIYLRYRIMILIYIVYSKSCIC
jgi:hypothetical protein